MKTQASFLSTARNPDVLSCIANLSNDEVFTPPSLVNQMLDDLENAWADSNGGDLIWSNPSVTFLDPCTKSGVFLREITYRLVAGQESQEKDLSERVDRILRTQIFGIGITNLTALLARRSVYCSKFADGAHSIFQSASSSDGNIWFERTEHSWEKGHCKFCGARKIDYERDDSLETHAYSFIHADKPGAYLEELFGEEMNFDVVIGNPPYQLSDGGGSGTSAGPIYQKFVEQAIRLDPQKICMVTPSRWFSGGKGLDAYREAMLNQSRIAVVVDFPDSSDVFPGVQIKGGVSYFVWSKSHNGDTRIETRHREGPPAVATRPLLEPGCDVFIRFHEAVEILNKVFPADRRVSDDSIATDSFMDLVSVRMPFGLSSTYRGHSTPGSDDLLMHRAGGADYVSSDEVLKGQSLIDTWKVFIPFLGSGSDAFPHPILGRPFIGRPGEVCNESYLVIGPFSSEAECSSVLSYISTRLFRFMVLLRKPSQNATRKVYNFVPSQEWSTAWTDDALYEMYGITQDEIRFIESLIRPMDFDDDE